MSEYKAQCNRASECHQCGHRIAHDPHETGERGAGIMCTKEPKMTKDRFLEILYNRLERERTWKQMMTTPSGNYVSCAWLDKQLQKIRVEL